MDAEYQLQFISKITALSDDLQRGLVEHTGLLSYGNAPESIVSHAYSSLLSMTKDYFSEIGVFLVDGYDADVEYEYALLFVDLLNLFEPERFRKRLSRSPVLEEAINLILENTIEIDQLLTNILEKCYELMPINELYGRLYLHAYEVFNTPIFKQYIEGLLSSQKMVQDTVIEEARFIRRASDHVTQVTGALKSLSETFSIPLEGIDKDYDKDLFKDPSNGLLDYSTFPLFLYRNDGRKDSQRVLEHKRNTPHHLEYYAINDIYTPKSQALLAIAAEYANDAIELSKDRLIKELETTKLDSESKTKIMEYFNTIYQTHYANVR